MKRGAICLVVALSVIFAPGLLFAQQESSQEGHHPAEVQVQGQSPEKQKLPDRHMMMRNMMAMHQKMMSKMQRMNTELDQKLTAMNAAASDKEQIAAMKAVIDAMVSQRKAMMSGIMGMQGKMARMMEGMEGKEMEIIGGGPMMMRRMKGRKNMVVIIQE